MGHAFISLITLSYLNSTNCNQAYVNSCVIYANININYVFKIFVTDFKKATGGYFVL